MSTYEKIASAIIAVFVVIMIIFSFHELREPASPLHKPYAGPDFNESVGSDFKIGPFATIVDERVSGGSESDCTALQPVILGVLHDITQRLTSVDPALFSSATSSIFEADQPIGQMFCNANATVTLSAPNGDTLILEKVPFTRAIPPAGTAADIGTDVRINATVVSAGAPAPTHPTTYGELLIPDRFLDTATSSSF
jgi:hypothetical protein